MSQLRRVALAGTPLARATVGSIRLHLLKIAAQVSVSVTPQGKLLPSNTAQGLSKHPPALFRAPHPLLASRKPTEDTGISPRSAHSDARRNGV